MLGGPIGEGLKVVRTPAAAPAGVGCGTGITVSLSVCLTGFSTGRAAVAGNGGATGG
ncbi:hypothetical protein ACE1SV_09650 [Streptomyces sennicomposti]